MARTLKDYPSVALNPADLGSKTDFVHIFGRSGPVHVEIGSGKGPFLLNQAQAEPDVNFLGIEWARRYYRYAVDRIGRWGLTNVRIIRTDAAQLIAEFVPAESVDCFHIYFPDPWPKKRHNKRRFFCQDNLERLLRCLKMGGMVKAATDYAEYFAVIEELFDANRDRLERADFLPAAGADLGEWVGSNFERKYLKEKRDIYTIAGRKL